MDKNLLKNNPTKVYHYFWLIFIIIIISSILLLSISESPFLTKKTYAHSIPISQTPSHDSILKKEELPSKVVIDFSERPIPGVSTIQVLNEKNERVDKGNFVIRKEQGFPVWSKYRFQCPSRAGYRKSLWTD